jgi:hypothetical protein
MNRAARCALAVSTIYGACGGQRDDHDDSEGDGENASQSTELRLALALVVCIYVEVVALPI